MYFTIDSAFNLIFPLVSWENSNMFIIDIQQDNAPCVDKGAEITVKGTVWESRQMHGVPNFRYDRASIRKGSKLIRK